MVRLRSFHVAILALGFAIPATSPVAQAATATTSFAVTANVVKACVVSATPVAFGAYNPVNATAVTATGTLTVACTATTPYQTGLSAGASAGASVTARKMTGATNTNLLSYGLYQDAARSINWGNTPGTDTPASATGTGLPQLATIYGQIASGTSGAIDTYSDTVTVTVTY